MFWTGFIVGISVGVIMGAVVAGLMHAAKDDWLKKIWNRARLVEQWTVPIIAAYYRNVIVNNQANSWKAKSVMIC